MAERPEETAHRQYEDMAVSHVLGGLSTEQGRVFRAHLVECLPCRARVGELRKIAHDLADVERDERRSVERRRVETKPVEVAVDDDPDEPRRPKRYLLLVVGALIAVIALGAWTVMLRSSNERLADQVALLERASVGIEFGDRWAVELPGESSSARGAVTTYRDDLVVLLEGVEDDRHQLFLLDDNGEQVRSIQRGFTPTSGRWLGIVPDVPNTVENVVVTRSDAVTEGPVGSRILEASRP